VLPNGMRRMAINRGQIDTLRSFELHGDDEAKRIELEEQLLGVALSDPAARILEDHATDINTECTPYEELQGPGTFTVAGVIKDVRKTKTKNGAEMAWVKLEQGGNDLDIAVWGTELKRLNFIWSKRKAVLIQVKVTEDNFVSLVAAKVLYSKEVKQNGGI
jgi:DNA polymerase III alpha subunit